VAKELNKESPEAIEPKLRENYIGYCLEWGLLLWGGGLDDGGMID